MGVGRRAGLGWVGKAPEYFRVPRHERGREGG